MCPWQPLQKNLGNLPNISYIIRNPKPLVTEFNIVCCPITGAMTYMEIQRGKEGMKNMHLQAELVATKSCTVRCAEGFHQGGEGLKASVKRDAWFGSVKFTVILAHHGRAFFGQVKSKYGQFPKDYIEESLKEEPGGTHNLLKCTHQEVDLITLRYSYISKRTFHFIFTSDTRSTTWGEPYEIKFTDNFSNIHVQYVYRPDIISHFFKDSNCVEKHNQGRQFELGLEKNA